MADIEYGFGRKYYDKGVHYTRLKPTPHKCRNPWCFTWQEEGSNPYPPGGGGGDGGVVDPTLQLTYSNVQNYSTSSYNYQGYAIA